MITFFRRIRQKLIDSGSATKYMLYAVGEILLVVIGILIALQVNNWNEEQKLNLERQQLIGALISDMESTRSRLVQGLNQGNELIERTERFLMVSSNSDLNAHLPVDTLRHLASGAFATVRFEALLTTYNQAVSTGRIGLLNDSTVLEQFSGFLLSYNDFRQHLNLSGQVFYLGSMWEIRRQIGNIHALGDQSTQRGKNQRYADQAYFMSDREYRDYISRPEVYAAVHNVLTIYYNLRVSLTNMDEAAAALVLELNRLQN